MGHDAYVRCNCLKEGRTKPYPFDYDFSFSEEGWLDVEGGPPPRSSRYLAVKTWLETACEHPQMRYVDVWLGTTQTVAAFGQLLKDIGIEHFPKLYANLPPVDYDGTMTPEAATQMLEDLSRFGTLESPGTYAVLMDSQTKRKIWDSLSHSGNIFQFGGSSRLMMGVDPDGFFIKTVLSEIAIDAMAGILVAAARGHLEIKELFRARQFERRVDYDTGNVVYIDLDSESRFVCEDENNLWQVIDMPGFQRGTWQSATRLSVERRAMTLDSFRTLLDGLQQVCIASIETGNPVRWY